MREFHIPAAAGRTTKSIRFPNRMICEVEQVLQGTECSFSAFVVEVVRVALDDLREQGTLGSLP